MAGATAGGSRRTRAASTSGHMMGGGVDSMRQFNYFGAGAGGFNPNM